MQATQQLSSSFGLLAHYSSFILHNKVDSSLLTKEATL
jgi:hypothetical protein